MRDRKCGRVCAPCRFLLFGVPTAVIESDAVAFQSATENHNYRQNRHLQNSPSTQND